MFTAMQCNSRSLKTSLAGKNHSTNIQISVDLLAAWKQPILFAWISETFLPHGKDSSDILCRLFLQHILMQKDTAEIQSSV